MAIIQHVENRTHRRLPLELIAGVAVSPGLLGFLVRKASFRCVTRDVSIQGIKLVADVPIPEGGAVKLWIKLPDAGTRKDLRLRGRVCWTTAQSVAGEYFAGIRLEAQPRRSMAVWTEAIRERIREQFRNPVSVGPDTSIGS